MAVPDQLLPEPGEQVAVSPLLPYGAGTRMLTIEQVCDWFQLPAKTVRGMVERQTIPYRKPGAALRFPERELEEWSRPKSKLGADRVIPLRMPAPVPRSRAKRGTGNIVGVSYD